MAYEYVSGSLIVTEIHVVPQTPCETASEGEHPEVTRYLSSYRPSLYCCCRVILTLYDMICGPRESPSDELHLHIRCTRKHAVRYMDINGATGNVLKR